MGFIDILISKLAPHACLGCGQEGILLCPSCTAALPDASCQQLGVRPFVAAATTYDSLAKDLVWRLKFQGAQAAAAIMARQMAPLIGPDRQEAIIVPVPTAARRARQRGYDQAKLIAHQLVKRTGLQYHDCLCRHGQAHQVGASREQRLVQLQTAFQVKKRLAPGSHLILVDDVLTTGATLEAAAGTLKTAGANRIDAVVFAYTE
ncbi:MAG TPA: phosphoribosyltransferase family protein [Candidatus Saccharimonadales bacterium]|nr:phosphoribosyltransferase family protein [Candidatus Saccharimonadales bacterium]